MVDAMMVRLGRELWGGSPDQGGGRPQTVRTAVPHWLGLPVVHEMSELQPGIRPPFPPVLHARVSRRTH
jgi:hypothetical protein